MHVDHVILAAGPDGLDAVVARLAAELGSGWAPGGSHPSWGTRNAVIPLAARAYLEVVEVVDRKTALGTGFGSAVADRCDAGGGWVGWVVAVPDVDDWTTRLDHPVVPGTRTRPDGTVLHWRTLASDVLDSDPALPFLITWDVPDELHPSAITGVAGAAGAPRLAGVELVGDRVRLAQWLGDDPGALLGGVDVDVTPWRAAALPGLHAVTCSTTSGAVRLT